MNAGVKTWGTLVALTVLMCLVPAASAAPAGAAHVAPALPRATTEDSLLNYSVPENKDVLSVTTSPDGSLVAGLTDGEQVLLFSASPTSTLTPIGVFSVPATVGIDASTIALTDASGSSSALLIIGYGGAVVALNVSASWTSEQDLNSITPVWQIVNFTSEFSLGSYTSPAYVHDVVASQTGTWIALQASYKIANVEDEVLFADFEDFHTVFAQSYYGNPVNIAIDAGGDWIAAGMNFASDSAIMIFQGTHGWVGNFTPPVATPLLYVAISGSGALCYGVSYQGIFIATTSTQQLNGTLSDTLVELGPNGQVSPSYSGSELVVGGEDQASYFNFTGGKWFQEWVGNYADPVANVSIASQNPDYFVISSGTSVYYYYLYSGMPSTSTAYYREFTTLGAVHQTILSNFGLSLAVGSSYINGEATGNGGEFTLSIDTGIPTPPAPVVTLTPQSATAGASAAAITVTWTEDWGGPITAQSLAVNLSSKSTTGSLPTSPIPVAPSTGTPPLTSSYTLNGLSFGTTYCVTVTVDAYGGASYASSSVVCATTVGVPPSTDPVQGFEIAAVGVLSVGLIGLLVLAVMGVTGGAAAGGLGRKKSQDSGGSPPPGPY